MSPTADLRIASKRAYYDNNKPYGESETITLYIYNAGPDLAAEPVVRAGYSYSMDYDDVESTLCQTQEWHEPSGRLRAGSLTWTEATSLFSHYEGWDIVTTLPSVPAGTLMELNLVFPMLHETSYKDAALSASVQSSTSDPRENNNRTNYIITPNHHNDGSAYWNTPGDLANLDWNGLTTIVPLSQADLRIASARAYYNNNLAYGQSETLTFLVFNYGPTTAARPVLKAGYTFSMDYNNISCKGEQAWVPEGTNPSNDLDNYPWQPLEGFSCHYVDWDVVCNLPDIPPTIIYRVKISFAMNHDTSYKDYTGTATISSNATELDPETNSTTYIITPNHNDDGPGYWNTKGNVAQLDSSNVPSGGRPCLSGWLEDTPIIVSEHDSCTQVSLNDLEKRLSDHKTSVMSYDVGKKSLGDKSATRVEYGTSADIVVMSFTTDQETQMSYSAHPDTLVYLEPTTFKVGQDEFRIGYWVPVQILWVGAAVRGMSTQGGLGLAHVTNIHTVTGAVHSSAGNNRGGEPCMVSTSHSYLVGKRGFGGVLTHNPRSGHLSGDPNDAAILNNLQRVADRLVATTTPPPNLPTPAHGYSLRYRRTSDPPRRNRPGPPVLPADVPRRDENGNWLIYLWEEDTPGVVENARYAVNELNHPCVLTYDRRGADSRRRQSTGAYQSQRELLQLNSIELAGPSGTTGQLDRDEYPPACSSEGGRGAVVTYIEAGDNRRAGCLMMQQFQQYRADPQPDGHEPFPENGRFRLAIIHENMAGVEYLGDGLDNETQIEQPPMD